jgi:hypothetical protein
MIAPTPVSELPEGLKVPILLLKRVLPRFIW